MLILLPSTAHADELSSSTTVCFGPPQSFLNAAGTTPHPTAYRTERSGACFGNKKTLGSGMLAGTSRGRNAREVLASAPQSPTPLATTREFATLPDEPRLASSSTRRLVCITAQVERSGYV
jgi:hypothetical protein